MINHILITGLLILYGFYLFYFNKCNINCFKKMSYKQVLWGMGAAFTGISGSIALITLLRRDEVTFIMPNVQPIVILFGAMVGYFVFIRVFLPI